jgi:RNA polymerase sigma factor (sigma-70 family)
MPDRDQTIIEAFMKGDRGAVDIIRKWTLTVCGCKSWGRLFADEDIVQETLVALYLDLKRGRYRGEGLRAYVTRICNNKCVDALRRHERNPVETGHEDCDAPDGRPTAEQRLEFLQRVRFAEEVLNELNPNDRQLVHWLHIEQLDRREIANRLGISDGALRKRICQCLKRVSAVRSRLEKG